MAKKFKGETKDDFILRLARKRFHTIQTAEAHIREAALEDIKFAYNVEDGQWADSDRKERESDGRPCLTSNKLRKFIAQISNKERDSRMAGKVVPVDSQADPQVAQIYQDIIRQIEFSSHADEVYDLGGTQAISGGFGYWRILSEEADDGFDQELKIVPIENQFSVYFDPKGKYCFIREGMTKDEFTEQWPNAAAVDFEGNSLGEEFELWYEDDTVFISEYYWLEPFDKKIVLAQRQEDPQPITVEVTDKVTEDVIVNAGFQILKRRTVKSNKVMWVKMTGTEVLEKNEWPDSEIPVIEVDGDKINIAGKVYKRSLIRDGKDPQKQYNYWNSSMTETVALAPNAPYLVTSKQIKNHSKMWNTANRRKLPYLVYENDGNKAPRREPPPQIPTGAMAMLQISNNDIKDSIGIFEAGLGEVGNERSGKAILARQSRSDTGTFHFPDNLRRAIRKTTRMLIRLIPKIYDTERIIRIRGANEEEGFIKINEAVLDNEGNTVIINDMSVGKYDLREDVRAFATKRQETADFLAQALQNMPDIAPFVLDLVFKFQDWPGAEEVEKRLKQFQEDRKQQQQQKGSPTP